MKQNKKLSYAQAELCQLKQLKKEVKKLIKKLENSIKEMLK